MNARSASLDPVTSVASLGDANRRRLYELVAASRAPVGRDDAAAALGMSRELAAFRAAARATLRLTPRQRMC